MKFKLVLFVIVFCVVVVFVFVDCDIVMFLDVGWIDIIVIIVVIIIVLDVFGYDIDVKVLFVLVIYIVLVEGDVDVFFGNWMLIMEVDIVLYCEVGIVDIVVVNFEGVKYMLVVNKVVVDLGIVSFVDIVIYKDVFDGEIYGIELGNDGNCLIMDMIVVNVFDLEGFEVVESLEQGMLVQVDCVDGKGELVVFFGWELYLMNVNFDMLYFEGGDDWFGLNFGGVIVYINILVGYVDVCLNVGILLINFVFLFEFENEIMGVILNDGEDFEDVVKVWLVVNLDVIGFWFEGVIIKDGGDVIVVVMVVFGM